MTITYFQLKSNVYFKDGAVVTSKALTLTSAFASINPIIF